MTDTPAAPTTPPKRTIYAVVYGNYDPPEVDSLWADEGAEE